MNDFVQQRPEFIKNNAKPFVLRLTQEDEEDGVEMHRDWKSDVFEDAEFMEDEYSHQEVDIHANLSLDQ